MKFTLNNNNLCILTHLLGGTDENWTYELIESNVKIIGYTGSEIDVNIPATITNKPVTYIGDQVFKSRRSLISITIPNSVTTIGNKVFEDCTSLTSITIPNSVTHIGEYSFNYCSSLTSITIPHGVTTIGAGVFRDCTSLNNVVIPDSVTNIGFSGFRGCTSLSNIIIPDSVTEILDSAFYGCTSLSSITIPDSLTRIDYSMFRGCTSLSNIIIPDSVTEILDSAFYGCTALTSITLPNIVTIKDVVFKESGLTSIIIPSSVTTIGVETFNRCANLVNVFFMGDTPTIKTHAFYREGDTNINIYGNYNYTKWNDLGTTPVNWEGSGPYAGAIIINNLYNLPNFSTDNKLSIEDSIIHSTLLSLTDTDKKKHSLTKDIIRNIYLKYNGESNINNTDIIINKDILPLSSTVTSEITKNKIRIINSSSESNISASKSLSFNTSNLANDEGLYVLTENDNDEITITTKYGKTIKTIKIKQKNATKYTITKNETDNDYSEGHSETYNGFFYILGSVTGQQQIKPQKIKPQRFGAYGDPYIITSKNQLYYLDIPNGNIRLFDSNTKNNKLVINGYIANLSKKNNQELLVDYLIKSRKFELLLDFDKLQFTQIPSFINKIYLNYNQEELLINMETFEIIKSTLNQDIKITEKYNKSRFIRDSKYKSFELEFRINDETINIEICKYNNLLIRNGIKLNNSIENAYGALVDCYKVKSIKLNKLKNTKKLNPELDNEIQKIDVIKNINYEHIGSDIKINMNF